MKNEDMNNLIPKIAGIITIFVSSLDIIFALYLFVLPSWDEIRTFGIKEIVVDLLISIAFFIIVVIIGIIGIKAGISAIKRIKWKFTLGGAIIAGAFFIPGFFLQYININYVMVV